MITSFFMSFQGKKTDCLISQKTTTAHLRNPDCSFAALGEPSITCNYMLDQNYVDSRFHPHMLTVE